MALSLVILAAGMGSRFGGPKQLLPIGRYGETIIDYNAYDGIVAGFDRLVFVTRAELEPEVAHVVRRGAGTRVDCRVVLQTVPSGRSKPLGTADAVAVGGELVDGPFAVANADDLYGPGSFAVLAEHLRRRGGDEGAVVGFPLRATVPAHGAVSRGILAADGDGFLTRIVETHGVRREGEHWHPSHVQTVGALTPDIPVSMNLWGFPLRTIPAMRAAVERFVTAGASGEVYLPEVTGQLVQAGQLRVRLLQSSERWTGITNPEDVEHVKQHAQSRSPSPLWE